MIWIGLTTLALIALLLAERHEFAAGVRIAKPLASLGFLGYAVHHGALSSPYGIAILGGLGCSWFGDVFLLSRRHSGFLAGLVAFFLAHVAYIAAFATQGPALGIVVGSILALLVPAWWVRRWLSAHVPSSLKRPVDLYMMVITGMVPTSIAAWFADGSTVMLIGAIAFYLSDLSVARDRFVAPGFDNRLWGLPLYYGAQLLLGSTCS